MVVGTIGLAGLFSATLGSGSAWPEALGKIGVPVSGQRAASLELAALSCAPLSAPRLAGQLMAETGFDSSARSSQGRNGIAALTDAEWQVWRPWTDAGRGDQTADVSALAHQMCDLVGQVRSARIPGDAWDLALAAHHEGLEAIRDTGGVPASAQPYLTDVHAFASWYERQAELRPDESAITPSVVAAITAVRIPDQLIQPIKEAGHLCGAVTPSRLAAQLMADYRFGPVTRPVPRPGIVHAGAPAVGPAVFPAGLITDPDPAQGSAAKGPAGGVPAVAVHTLARSLCDSADELAPLGGDPYQLALAARLWGATAVRQAGRVPEAATVRDYERRVLGYADVYAHDTRLLNTPPPESTSSAAINLPAPRSGRAPAKPSGSKGTRSGSKSAGSVKGSGAGPTTSSSGGTKSSASSGTTSSSSSGSTSAASSSSASSGSGSSSSSSSPLPKYKIVSRLGNRCLDVTDGGSASGTPLQVWDCTGADWQLWTFTGGTVRSMGKCMSVGSTANGSRVKIATCNGNSSQQFSLNGAGDLVNAKADKCVDVLDRNDSNGTKLQIWACTGDTNQKWYRG
jgi:hypothetical protein